MTVQALTDGLTNIRDKSVEISYNGQFPIQSVYTFEEYIRGEGIEHNTLITKVELR